MKRALWAFGLAAVVGGAVAPAVAEQAAGVVEAVDPERRAVTLQGDPRTYLLSRVMPLVAEAIRIEPGDRVILTYERNADIDVVIHVEGDGMDLRAMRRPPGGGVALVLDPQRPTFGVPPAMDAGAGAAPAAPGGVAAVPVPPVARGAVTPEGGAVAPLPLVPQVAGTVVEMNAATRTVMLDNGQAFRVDPSIGMAALRPGNRVVLRLGERAGEFRVVEVVPR